MQKFLIALLSAFLLTTNAMNAAELSAEDLDRRRKALNDLIVEHWEYTLQTSPEYASLLGDKRYNRQVSDLSEAAVNDQHEQVKKFARRLSSISATGFSEQERLNRDLLVRDLVERVEGNKFKAWRMPVNQMSGIHLDAARLPSLLTFATGKDFADYLGRLRQFPKQIDDTIANMRRGMAERQMPPGFLLEKVADQAGAFTKQEPEKTPFAAPLAKLPSTMPPADQARYRNSILDAIRTNVLPAYAKFAKFIREEYAPKGRTDVGIWSLPDGAARYAYLVRVSTATNLTPGEIHQIGLREVARIEGEMLLIAQKQGFGDLDSFNKSIETNPDLKAKSRQHIVELYRKYTDQMHAKLPQLFGRLPRANVEIRQMEEFREKNAAGADYDEGAPDGSRPGRVNVNTYEATSRKTISFESTAYHEGLPGHHMQISLAQQQTDLPMFRRMGGNTAFAEGWALYSERLGKELGFYEDPFSDYGRLQDEMLRAIRLVVDTGLHAKKWNREQVVQYFRDHSAIDEVDVQSETDRYIAWPGQALAYKIGQLKIIELRERAQRELRAKFDIREFHDEVLGAGALPLESLEKRIDQWIAVVRVRP